MLLTHALSAADAALIVGSAAPVAVVVASNDRLIPPRQQRALAALLAAQEVWESGAGHMGAVAEAAGRVAAGLVWWAEEDRSAAPMMAR